MTRCRNGWDTVTLPEISTVFTDGPFGSNLKSAHYVDYGVRVIRLQNIGVGKMLNDDLVFISREHYESLPRNHCKPGDVVIGTLGDPNLRACVIPPDVPEALNKADCLLLRLDENRADRNYICAALNSDVTVKRAMGLVRGQTRGRISMGRLKELKIPLPPLAEQKRIAGILDAADALRAKRREALAQLDTLLQSTFLDMFGDPVTNPMGWEIFKFGTLGQSRLGKMLDKGKQVGNCQFPYLANYNVQWGMFRLDELRTMDFDEEDRREFALHDGDLLICEGGEVGRTAIWRNQMRNVYFQKALHRVRLDETIAVPEYVQYFMWFMAKNGGFKDFTTAATIAHLTGVKLKNLPTPVPPLDLQRRFAAIVESVERQKARMRSHLTELDALFASLQSRAFNGEL